MSPELETLDQLLGGNRPLESVLDLDPDSGAFRDGVPALLSCGDVRLPTSEGLQVPEWRWRELFNEGTISNELGALRLGITEQDVCRIA